MLFRSLEPGNKGDPMPTLSRNCSVEESNEWPAQGGGSGHQSEGA